jgi:hypothetical protein
VCNPKLDIAGRCPILAYFDVYIKQMIWRCVSRIHWESGKSRTELFPRRDNLLDFNRYLYNLSQIPSEHTANHPDDFQHQYFIKYQDWYRLVKIYTERELTKRSDKLPAIGGVANILPDRIKDSYCAGLWRGELIFGLILKHNGQIREPEWKEGPFTLEYPSWSRISFCSSVYFPFSLFRMKKGGRLTPLVLLEDVSIAYSSASIFGSLKRGELVLTRQCYFTSTLDGSRNDPENNNSPLFHAFLAQSLNDDKEFQNRRQKRGGQFFAILQIARVEEKFVRDRGDSIHQSVLTFLILERFEDRSWGTEGSNTHYCRRVGMIRLHEYLKKYSPEGELLTDEEFVVDESVGIELRDRPWSVGTVRIL